MIVEVDVWHTGTDAELQQLVKTEPGMPLEGHPDLVCVHAVIEEEAPIAQAKPQARVATDAEILKGATPDEMKQGIGLLPAPQGAKVRLYQDPTPEPMPGRKRARLNYGPRPTK